MTVHIATSRMSLSQTLIFFTFEPQVRNLSEIPSTKAQLVDCGLLQSLVFFLKQFPRDTELALNISRILSKMTLCTDVCLHLLDYRRAPAIYKAEPRDVNDNEDDLFAALFAVLTTHVQKADLVVRVLFILGNLTAKSDEARARLWLFRRKEAERGSVETAPVKVLVSTFLNYVDMMAMEESATGTEEKPKEPSKVEDVLIKLVR